MSNTQGRTLIHNKVLIDNNTLLGFTKDTIYVIDRTTPYIQLKDPKILITNKFTNKTYMLTSVSNDEYNKKYNNECKLSFYISIYSCNLYNKVKYLIIIPIEHIEHRRIFNNIIYIHSDSIYLHAIHKDLKIYIINKNLNIHSITKGYYTEVKAMKFSRVII